MPQNYLNFGYFITKTKFDLFIIIYLNFKFEYFAVIHHKIFIMKPSKNLNLGGL